MYVNGNRIRTPVVVVSGTTPATRRAAIEHELLQRPEGAVWGVLTGTAVLPIDALRIAPRDGVLVREVAGACACCMGSLVLQTALVEMLRRHHPDRVLIEADAAHDRAALVAMIEAAPLCDAVAMIDLVEA